MPSIGFVLLGSYHAIGTTNTIWLPLCQAIGQTIITFYAFKYGKGKWQLLDKICLAGAAMSLVLWWGSGSPLSSWVQLNFDNFEPQQGFGVHPFYI